MDDDRHYTNEPLMEWSVFVWPTVSGRSSLSLQNLSGGRILLQELCQGVLSCPVHAKNVASRICFSVFPSMQNWKTMWKWTLKKLALLKYAQCRSASPNLEVSVPQNGHGDHGLSGHRCYAEAAAVFTVSFLECTKIKTCNFRAVNPPQMVKAMHAVLKQWRKRIQLAP